MAPRPRSALALTGPFDMGATYAHVLQAQLITEGLQGLGRSAASGGGVDGAVT